MEQRHVVMHCNAGGEYGMGHLMRCLTLADEADRQGWRVTLVGDIDVRALARVQHLAPYLDAASVVREGGKSALLAAVRQLDPDLVHADSYWPEADALIDLAVPISNMQDGSFGVRPATLAVDANLGAEHWFDGSSQPTFCLAGAPATLVRPQVRAQRSVAATPHSRLRVLIVLGGTDPHHYTPQVVEALSHSDTVWDVTVIRPPALVDSVDRASAGSKHTIDRVDFAEDLPTLARQHDAVITAAGTSVWDFACMGVPMGLVCVTENQKLGYIASVDANLAIGMSSPHVSSLGEGVRNFERVMRDSARRTQLRDHGMDLIDGLGSWRVVSSWAQLTHPPTPSPSEPLYARAAHDSDSQMLFDWRNDPVTRAASRSTAPLEYSAHVEWLASVLSDDSRHLFVIERDAEPVGTVRWDHLSGDDWEVSISVAPSQRGRGIGASVLAAGETALRSSVRPARLIAAINSENSASQRLFERAGYLPYSPPNEDGFFTLSKLIIG